MPSNPSRAGEHGLGDLEALVLIAVVRLGDGAYAVSVRDEIARRTRRDLSRGAVYVTLDRLERKGFVRSRLGEPTAMRGGKAKRMFTITAAGRRALTADIAETSAMLAELPYAPGWKAPR